MTNENQEPQVEAKNEHGIEDVLDVTDYVQKLAAEMKVANVDGKISIAEVGVAVGKTAKDGIEAAMGSWNIPKQIADMNAEEKDKVLDEALKALFAVAEVFMPSMKG